MVDKGTGDVDSDSVLTPEHVGTLHSVEECGFQGGGKPLQVTCEDGRAHSRYHRPGIFRPSAFRHCIQMKNWRLAAVANRIYRLFYRFMLAYDRGEIGSLWAKTTVCHFCL